MKRFEQLDQLIEKNDGTVQTFDKNLRTLMQYAALFHVEKMLRQYLEMLL